MFGLVSNSTGKNPARRTCFY
ncbi:MAG: hypothetical protein ACQEUB_03345 [Thermodesulfobacteriota bacterium]